MTAFKTDLMKWIARIFAFVAALLFGVFVALLFDIGEESRKTLMPFSSRNCEHASFRSENELRIDPVAFERGRQLGDPYLKLTIHNTTPCYVYYGAAHQQESFVSFRVNGRSSGRPPRTGGGIESVAIPPYGSAEIEITPFEFPFQPGMYDFVTAEIRLTFEDEDAPRVVAAPPFVVPNDFRLKIPMR
jgi:hypothetical protein